MEKSNSYTALVALMTGVNEETYENIKEANSLLDDVSGELFKRKVLKAASTLLKLRGTEESKNISAYLKVASETKWSALHADLYKNIMDVISFHKFAATSSSAAEILAKTFFGLPLLAGGALGTLMFGLNRSTKNDTNKNEALKAKIKYYDMITSELENRLSHQNKNTGI